MATSQSLIKRSTMSRSNGSSRAFCLIAVIIAIVISTAGIFLVWHTDTFSIALPCFPETTPWQSIGGCGLGGSGGSGQSGVQWMGKGIQGHLVTIEMLPEISYGTVDDLTFAALRAGPRLSFHPSWQTELSLSLPTLLLAGEVQQQSNFSEEVHLNSGTGDITAALTHSFGNGNAWSAVTSITFPTGVYDAQYGAEQSRRILPHNLQTGRGVYSASAGLLRTWTIEDGIVRFGGTFNYPFNVRFDKDNHYLDSDYKAYRYETVNRERFHYRHIVKPYGESDRGDYYPPSLETRVAGSRQYGGVLVHSLQVSFTANFGVRWIRDYDPTRYAPVPDPDHTAWDALVFYGIEYSGWHCPVFAGFGLPLSDKRGDTNCWDGIDTDALLQRWLCVAGITVGLF